MTNDEIRAKLKGKNASRKAEREAIAQCLCTIAERHGAEIRRTEADATAGYCGAGIDLEFTLRGVGAMISIDDLHGGETALLSWYNAEHGGLPFSVQFNRAVGESLIGRSHHKASSLGGDWYSLAMFLDGGLLLAKQGRAFKGLDAAAVGEHRL